jgi:1-phosphofructokinase family hexose kinase
MALQTVICVSVNPALDRRIRLQKLTVGAVNRAQWAEALPGGKAAHVAMALTALGVRAVWLGFLGGAIGQYCAEGLRARGIEVEAVKTEAATRVNLEVVEESGMVTEILDPGTVPGKERDELLSRLKEDIEKWDAAVVVSGSLPAGMAPEYYAEIIELSRDASVKTFFDSSGTALAIWVAAKPDFVKVNRHEAEVLLGLRVENVESAIAAAKDLIKRGAGSAAITLGAEGVVWVEAENGPVWIAQGPSLDPVSTVGCGDATLAGFVYAAMQKLKGEAAIRLAAACGAANCCASAPGQISQSEVQKHIPAIRTETSNRPH